MLTLGNLPPSSKLQLLCQMVSSKIPAYLSTGENMWRSSFTLLTLPFFVCPMEIIAFSGRAEEFKKLNCQVIGAPVDSHFCHLAWINTPRKQGGLRSMNIPWCQTPSAPLLRTMGSYRLMKASYSGASLSLTKKVSFHRSPQTTFLLATLWMKQTSSGFPVH